MLNDILILKKIKEGDIGAFESTFRLYYTPLYLYALSITGRNDIAEEIVQELFYHIWKDREGIPILYSLKSYLYKSVRNKSLQYCEHRSVEERYRDRVLKNESLTNSDEELDPLNILELKELQTMINRTLRRLPERCSQIFRMHRVEGRKYKEIADSLSLSVKTVEAEMSKAYKLLRSDIEKYTKGL